MTRIFSILTIALCFAFSHTASAQDTLKVLPQSGDPQAQPLLGIVDVLAQSGDPQAQNRLGMVYFNGVGVPQDFVYSHMWFNISASLGAPDSAQLRDEVAKNMTPAQIALAQQLARECVRREYKDC